MLTRLLLILFCAGTVSAQTVITDPQSVTINATAGNVEIHTLNTPRLVVENNGKVIVKGNTFKVGDASNPDSARVAFATEASATEWSFGARSFTFDNGPGGTTYKDHTSQWAYNSDFNGTKLIPGEVHFGWVAESDWYGAPIESEKQSEHYFTWTSPDGTITQRPTGFVVKHQSGNVFHHTFGDHVFSRNVSQGGAVVAKWHESGMFDLSYPAGDQGIIFRNNANRLLWKNATNSNTIAPIWVDNQNRVQVGGNQDTTVINSLNLSYNDKVKRGSVQILGSQCAAILNSNGSQADDTRAINAVLSCLRSHGVVAP